MHEIEKRLIGCFTAVFPDLRPEDTPQASVDTVAGWDSLATALLVTTVEEEFGFTVDGDALDQMCSFDQVAAVCRSQSAVKDASL
jgi:acyl carrier protein